jgi:hypothetical protein
MALGSSKFVLPKEALGKKEFFFFGRISAASKGPDIRLDADVTSLEKLPKQVKHLKYFFSISSFK